MLRMTLKSMLSFFELGSQLRFAPLLHLFPNCEGFID